MSLPVLVFVPGIWGGPSVFDLVVEQIHKLHHDVDVRIAPFLSPGTTSPGGPSMIDDMSAIRKVVEPLVANGQRVIMVCHSAGGFLGSGAIKGLEVGSSLDRKGACRSVCCKDEELYVYG